MVFLQRQNEERSDKNDLEQEFFLHTLECLAAFNGCDVIAGNWMITPYEVEFGQRIGVGGLYIYIQDRAFTCAIISLICGEVHKGTWHNSEVSIKTFKTKSGFIPSPTVYL